MAHGIEDVARAAGVSTATVSRALRHLPNVTPATRERVLRVAAEMGYHPSPSAASLASGRTRTIGLLTPWVHHWFFANVIEGAERALRLENFDALLYTFEVTRGGPRRRVDPTVLRGRVDGVLVVGLPLHEAEVRSLIDLACPLVFVGTGIPGQVTVGLDDVAVAREATEFLLQLGHRRIAHLTGTPDEVSNWLPFVERERGWRQAMRAAGVEPDDELVVHGYFDTEGGRESMARLLDGHQDITAIFAASDEMAMGAILAARDRGLRVPRDVSVIGVDGHDLGELVGLTTMAQDATAQGAAAAAMVLEMLTGAPVPTEVTYPTTMVVRGSTGPVPVRSTLVSS